MMDEQIVRRDVIDEIAIVARQRLETPVRALCVDLRLVAGAPQRALDAQHGIADGVAISQRGEHLMDAGHQRITGPAGAASSTCCAGGTERRRRANQLGRGSIAGRFFSRFSRSNSSRYFRSTTGQLY